MLQSAGEPASSDPFGTVLPIDVQSSWYNKDKWVIPAVSASAVRDKAGVVHVGLANLDPNRESTIIVSLAGLAASGVRGRIVTAPAINALNDFDHPSNVVSADFSGARLQNGSPTVTLPAKSVVMLDLR